MPLTGYYDVTQSYSGHSGADPSGLTDSTAAIRYWANTCASATPAGGVVWFPPGTYLVSSNSGACVTLGSGVELRGAGSGCTTIKSGSSPNIPNTVVSATSVNDVAIRDLSFLGHIGSPSPSVRAPAAVTMSTVARFKAENCEFSNNQGQTIVLTGVSDGEVYDCSFNNVGYNDGTHSGNNWRTDVVSVDTTSEAVRIHDNYIDNCLYGGIYVQGSDCDISHNTIISTVNNAIYLSGAGTRVGFNTINTCTQQRSGATSVWAIQADGASNFVVLGNTVKNSDGDGIAVTNGWLHGVILGNNVGNSASQTSAGNSGIYVQGATNLNEGLVLMGNNVWCETGTQQYGLNFGGTKCLYGAIMANNTYASGGTLTTGIQNGNNFLQDDSVTVYGNTYWLDRIHTAAPATATGSSLQTLVNQQINSGSFRQSGGIRITAGGSTDNGTLARKLTLSFGTQTVMTAAEGTWTPTANQQPWQLLAVIMNNDFTNNPNAAQAALVLLWANGNLVFSGEVLLTQSSNTSLALLLQGQCGTGTNSDTLTMDFLTVERC